MSIPTNGTHTDQLQQYYKVYNRVIDWLEPLYDLREGSNGSRALVTANIDKTLYKHVVWFESDDAILCLDDQGRNNQTKQPLVGNHFIDWSKPLIDCERNEKVFFRHDLSDYSFPTTKCVVYLNGDIEVVTIDGRRWPDHPIIIKNAKENRIKNFFTSMITFVKELKIRLTQIR